MSGPDDAGRSRPASLTIHYLDDGGATASQVVSMLDALRFEYEDVGLAVIVDSYPHDSNEVTRARSSHQLGAFTGNDVLSLVTESDSVLVAQSLEELDLYRVYQLIESNLYDGRRLNYLQHLALLVDGMLAGRESGVLFRGEERIQVADYVEASDTPVLFVPPGCTECVLAKYDSRLAALFRKYPGCSVITYSADTQDALYGRGWKGDMLLLDVTHSAEVFGLRRSGTYLPALLFSNRQEDIRIQSIATWKE